MRVRPAGLLDLSRIEEMHRSSEIRVSAAAPPAARLWSLLSSTLSALLPLSQLRRDEASLTGAPEAAA